MTNEFSFAQILQLIGESMGGFLPFLIAALAVLFGGWIVAKILSSVVRRGLRRLRLGERLIAGPVVRTALSTSRAGSRESCTGSSWS